MSPSELAERLDIERGYLVALSIAAMHDGDALDSIFRAVDQLQAASGFLRMEREPA